MTKKIAVLPGDGIGQEIVAEAVKVLNVLKSDFGLDVEMEEGLVGGTAYDATGTPLPDTTLDLCKASDAVLLGAVGGYKWESLPIEVRPEKGLLGLRAGMELFANLRPAILYPQLADASTLKPEVVSGLDIMIVRELTGGIYFGQPRGVRALDNGERQGYNTLVYSESEVSRIGKVAFDIAMKRDKRVCSVDKANVLECTEMWREVMIEEGRAFPDVELSHMYVDNAAMQLVRAPKQFDVMVTTNMFGDILSDCAAMLTGSIGMLPSASLDANSKGMYEPIHGSAPDIAGQNLANPLATILSVAMMLRYTLDEPAMADRIESAVNAVLDQGKRTADIWTEGCEKIGTDVMGDAVIAAMRG
ncbi:3-isopropylmalate dehydrogenase [Solemya pervernicosa gill symbiont]|uniref:3-isopropylmalate dehydrogenase n=2 Tax=Gammaproteobacteria incertae sedis TaxID=118884 RepID=A0A1T2L701_9GAMM|nr:3-isopropylmalate dehydrogenase [Candidatus Reidiella endopervernicosa]OOZ40814.1 3-isopropylmalate dehydrogenase [Solemya pervernicosa gill symbiont]QKQ26325.1 3-isopropylmalate dehydrogenase [Candidatus Reidiella endopervernicosa]